jgi:hypothetical protein
MNPSTRVRRHIRSNVIGYLALFIALTMAPAWAAGLKPNSVRSKHIVNGQVKTKDLAANAVKSPKVAPDSLTGADINESTLQLDVLPSGPPTGPAGGGLTGSYPNPQVRPLSIGTIHLVSNSVGFAQIAQNSVTGAKQVSDNSLTGADINESQVSVANFGCQGGKVLGFARVKGTAAIPTSYSSSSAYIDFPNNCSGGAVQVRKDPFGAGTIPGVYYVRFVNNPAALAIAVSNADGLGINNAANDNVISVAKITGGADAGAFRVMVMDVDQGASGGADAENGAFTILLP